MSTFLYSYRTPKTYTAGSPDNVAAWSAWLQGIGANLVDAGKPVLERRTLGNCPPETLQGGYSLVTADDIEAAVDLAEGCPGLRDGFGLGRRAHQREVSTRLGNRRRDRRCCRTRLRSERIR